MGPRRGSLSAFENRFDVHGDFNGVADHDAAFVEQGIPGFYFSLGGADPGKLAEAKAAGTRLPSNHSPLFAPDVDPSLRTAIEAEIAVLRNLLNGSPDELRKLTMHATK